MEASMSGGFHWTADAEDETLRFIDSPCPESDVYEVMGL